MSEGDAYDDFGGDPMKMRDEIHRLRATVEVLGKLPGKWRTLFADLAISDDVTLWVGYCARELEDAVRQGR